MNQTRFKRCWSLVAWVIVALFVSLPIGAQVSTEVLDSISTPDQVMTSIGRLEFLDGAPYPETAGKVYDYLDTMRGVEALLKGMPGAFNDAWFRYVQDVGPAGPDKGKGGKYLVLPPRYEGEVPQGYFVVRPRTYDVWVFMRASIAKGLDVARKNVVDNLRV
jgi:hypothetical protein